MLEKITDYFMPNQAPETVELIRKYRLIVNTALITICFAINYSLLCYAIGLKACITVMSCSVCWYIIILFLFKNNLNPLVAANLYVFGGVTSIILSIYFTNGFNSPVLPWLATSPIVALLIAGRKSGVFWAAINSISIIIFNSLTINNFNYPKVTYHDYYNFFNLNCYVGLVLVVFVLSIVFENGKNSALNKLIANNILLAEEKEKSDNLLLNILPADISQELKETGKTKAYSYKIATVMFADFVNFTVLGEKLSPEDLVHTIGAYFEAFDNIIEKHGIEKIKTVGDAYICAAGLPIATTDNALIMIDVALDFIEAMEEMSVRRKLNGQEVFDIRIGINTGPLVAGVVGIKKFAYDIWGDTVNTAARMQEKGAPNRINISGSTYELVKDKFDCEYRGKIQAKNKGEIDMYFISRTDKTELVS